jgi:hypothetical protein
MLGDCCANSKLGSTPGRVTTRNTVVAFSYGKACDSCQKRPRTRQWLRLGTTGGCRVFTPRFWAVVLLWPRPRPSSCHLHLFAGYREQGGVPFFQTCQAPRRPAQTTSMRAGVKNCSLHTEASQVIQRDSMMCVLFFSINRESEGRMWQQQHGCWPGRQHSYQHLMLTAQGVGGQLDLVMGSRVGTTCCLCGHWASGSARDGGAPLDRNAELVGMLAC